MESKSRAPFDDLTSQDRSPLPYVLESQLDKSGHLYALENSAKKQASATPLTVGPRPPLFQACVRGTRAPQNLPAQPNLKIDLQKSIIEAKEVDLNDEQETENHRYPENTHDNEEADANNLNRNLSDQVSKDDSANGKERLRQDPGNSSAKTRMRLVTMENSDELLEQPDAPNNVQNPVSAIVDQAAANARGLVNELERMVLGQPMVSGQVLLDGQTKAFVQNTDLPAFYQSPIRTKMYVDSAQQTSPDEGRSRNPAVLRPDQLQQRGPFQGICPGLRKVV